MVKERSLLLELEQLCLVWYRLHRQSQTSSQHLGLCFQGLDVGRHVIMLLERSIQFLDVVRVSMGTACQLFVIFDELRDIVDE